MTDPMLKLQVLARSEMALLKIQARRNATRAVLLVLALVFALFALGMLNLAGYQALLATYEPALAALFVALANAVLAILVTLIARGTNAHAEQEKMVREIRDLAYNELSADINEVKSQFTRVTEDVRNIRSAFGSFAGGSGALASNLASILSLLIAVFRKEHKK